MMRKKARTPLRPDDATLSNDLSIGEIILSQQILEQLARETGVIQRKARKVDPLHLLGSLIAQCAHGSPSYNDLAADIESRYDTDPSRQAVAQRLNKAFENFLGAILGQVMAMRIKEELPRSAGRLSRGPSRHQPWFFSVRKCSAGDRSYRSLKEIHS